MAYAQGKYALGICDRCGFQYKLNTLRKEWTGFKVCIECYETKHPQLEVKRNVSDAIALRDARPDVPATVAAYAGTPGDTAFQSDGMQPSPSLDLLAVGVALGNVKVLVS